jgi:hypothetical protein
VEGAGLRGGPRVVSRGRVAVRCLPLRWVWGEGLGFPARASRDVLARRQPHPPPAPPALLPVCGRCLCHLV